MTERVFAALRPPSHDLASRISHFSLLSLCFGFCFSSCQTPLPVACVSLCVYGACYSVLASFSLISSNTLACFSFFLAYQLIFVLVFSLPCAFLFLLYMAWFISFFFFFGVSPLPSYAPTAHPSCAISRVGVMKEVRCTATTSVPLHLCT